jgi:hypothetical protein
MRVFSLIKTLFASLNKKVRYKSFSSLKQQLVICFCALVRGDAHYFSMQFTQKAESRPRVLIFEGS